MDSILKMRELLVGALFCAIALPSFAQTTPITSNQFTVLRLGDGTTALSASNASSVPVYLDVYNLTSGTLAQSIQLSNSNFSYTNGLNRDGIYQLSQNGQYLSIGGYAAAPGTPTPISTSVNFSIARVSVATGAVDYSTSFPSNGNPIRSVATADGSNFWVATDGSNAILSVPFGNTASTPATSIQSGSWRAVNVSNNQLYAMSGSSGWRGIATVGSGLPTTAGQSFSTFTPSPNPASGPGVSSMFFANANTIYATGSAYDTGTGDDFREYHFENGSWVLKASVGSPGGPSSAYGIFATPDPSIPGNYLVYMSTSTAIYRFSDDPTSSTSFPTDAALAASTPLITVGNNEQFRGIAPAAIVPEPGSLLTVTCMAFGSFGWLTRRRNR